MSKTIKIIHSKTGLAALILGLRISAADPASLEALPRLMKLIKRPGQLIIFESEKERLICLKSAGVGNIVDKLCESTSRIWGRNIMSHYVREGRGVYLRSMLFALLKSKWLIATELKALEANTWK